MPLSNWPGWAGEILPHLLSLATPDTGQQSDNLVLEKGSPEVSRLVFRNSCMTQENT